MRSDGTLDSGFSSDNVEVNAAAPVDGKVKFTVVPKIAGSPNALFLNAFRKEQCVFSDVVKYFFTTTA